MPSKESDKSFGEKLHVLAENIKKGEGQLLLEFPAMPGRHYRINHETDIHAFIDYTIKKVSSSSFMIQTLIRLDNLGNVLA